MRHKPERDSAGITEQAGRIERDLGAIRRALRRPLEAEQARGGLTSPQTAIMSVVVRHNGVSLKDLSREVSLAHSTVSGIVDRLEKRGMIERRADPADGRISRIHPTAIVTRWIREEMPVLARGPLQSALVRVSAHERVVIEKTVARLRELLEKS